jgi:hypothetical protein
MFRKASSSVALFAALAFLAGTASRVVAQGTITSTPYSQYGPGTGGYYNYPYVYSDLYGAASVIQAQGQIMVNQQQAFLEREKVRAARIDNRRKELEQFLWEREHMPTPEDDRQRFEEEQRRRALFGADLTEVWSARALNNLLKDASKITATSADASIPPLSDDVLAKINVTSGKGDVGLLKGARLAWPLLLKRADFEKEREHLNYLAQRIVQQAGAGQIKPEDLEAMNAGVDQLQQRLGSLAREAGDNATWTQTMYSEAKSFLGQFEQAVRALQQPDAANFLSDKYSLKGKNIADIVKFMTEKGLQFAPATDGGQAAYNAVYQALRSYDDQAGSKTRGPR